MGGVQGERVMSISSIPLDHPTILRVKGLIPQKFWDRAWVGGSAATRFPQNNDVDVWVCVNTSAEWAEVTNAVPPPTDLEDNAHRYVHASQLFYNHDGLQMFLTASPIKEVVGGFDISCHAGAIHLVTGEVHIGCQYQEGVRIYQWRDARRTLERGIKFSRRYDDEDFWTDDMTLRAMLESILLSPTTYGGGEVSRTEVTQWLLMRVRQGL